MKVIELINLLIKMDPDAEVHYAYPSRDHWRTVLAPKVRKVEEGVVEHNGYHDMDEVSECGDVAETDEQTEVVILE